MPLFIYLFIHSFRYRWQQNGKDFNPSGNDDRVATQPGKGTLIFARPLKHDEAIYQCFAHNEAGVASTIKVELRQASEYHRLHRCQWSDLLLVFRKRKTLLGHNPVLEKTSVNHALHM